MRHKPTSGQGDCLPYVASRVPIGTRLFYCKGIMQRPGDEVTRPITLYVEKIDTKPDLNYTERRRVSVVDVELTCEQAAQLFQYLKDCNCTGFKGAVRVRLSGRLIIT